jgi:CO dehydrogenase nickel-insertion accessory protein CooC1
MVEIIGLLGHQGVGKNYIAEKILPKLLPNKNTVVLAFADHFKIDCISKYGAEYDKVYGEKDFKTRKLLQKVGTEEGRNKYGDDIWIKTLDNWIKTLNSRGVERFIISDVRFNPII